jgi:hypothetical protein
MHTIITHPAREAHPDLDAAARHHTYDPGHTPEVAWYVHDPYATPSRQRRIGGGMGNLPEAGQRTAGRSWSHGNEQHSPARRPPRRRKHQEPNRTTDTAAPLSGPAPRGSGRRCRGLPRHRCDRHASRLGRHRRPWPCGDPGLRRRVGADSRRGQVTVPRCRLPRLRDQLRGLGSRPHTAGLALPLGGASLVGSPSARASTPSCRPCTGCPRL